MLEYKFLLFLFSVNFTLVVGGWKEHLIGVQGSHALTKGQRSTQPKDSRLHKEIIENNKQPFMQGIIDGTYCYPPTDTLDDQPPIVITMYEAVDMGSGKNGGEAFEYSGGVDKNQVCVYIRSQWGGRYKYKFTVFGYPKDLAAEAGLKPSRNGQQQ